MMPMMYKGYTARIDYSGDDSCFVGRVAGIRDLITFHGETVAELRRAFEEAVDFYLTTCAERGETPSKPCSGKLMLCLPPEVHAHAAMMAADHWQSLNQWAKVGFGKFVPGRPSAQFDHPLAFGQRRKQMQ